MKEIFLVNSTVGKSDVYFEPIYKKLVDDGYRAEIVTPSTPYLKDLEREIINRMERDNYSDHVLVGHSFAGNAVLGAAHECPERVDKVVVTDSILCWEEQPLLDKILEFVLSNFPKAITKRIVSSRKAMELLLDSALRDRKSIPDKTYRRMVDSLLEQGVEWNLAVYPDGKEYTSCSTRDWMEVIEELLAMDVDVHYIASSDEAKKFVKNCLIYHLPRSHIHEISNASHLPMLENPEEFYEVLVEIISR